MASSGGRQDGERTPGLWSLLGSFLPHRIKLGQYIVNHSRKLHRHREALAEIVREGLRADKPLPDRIRRVTELGAEALGADFCSALQGSEQDGRTTVRVIDIWDPRSGKHFSIPDIPANDSPGYHERLARDQYVCAADAFASPLHGMRLDLFRRLGIRAVLAAAPQGYERGLGAVVFAFGVVHRWSESEIAFARNMANIVALLFSSARASQTLATLDLIDEGIYVLDPQGQVRYFNRAATEMARVFGGEGRPEYPAPDQPLTGTEDLQTISRAGRDVEIRRLRLPGGEILARINDVTARNAALAERQRLEAKLQQAGKMEAIGQLAGGVAHDFNNILGSILGFAGFLAEDLPTGSPSHGHALRILRATNRGKELVEQTLAFANTHAVDFGVVDLCDVLERNRETLGELAADKSRLDLKPHSCPLVVAGNAVMISQLIANLCKNARDALGDRDGRIAVSVGPCDEAELARLRGSALSANERLIGEFKDDRHYCHLRVEDDGSGIAAELLDRIFEPFFTTKGRHRGSGLGLAVVHGVARSHYAVMHVRSAVGKGAVFTVYFPLAQAAALAIAAANANAQDVQGSERVLVVDDEPDLADALTIGLERLGYQAVGANHPVDALAAITEDPTAFDVLITDELMPVMRGMALIRAAKVIKPDLKVVLCTGHSANATEDSAKAAGADIFFYKPVNAAQISARLRSLLASKS